MYFFRTDIISVRGTPHRGTMDLPGTIDLTEELGVNNYLPGKIDLLWLSTSLGLSTCLGQSTTWQGLRCWTRPAGHHKKKVSEPKQRHQPTFTGHYWWKSSCSMAMGHWRLKRLRLAQWSISIFGATHWKIFFSLGRTHHPRSFWSRLTTTFQQVTWGKGTTASSTVAAEPRH